MLAKYMEAEAAVLAGKAITFQGRSMTMENLNEIRAGRREWEQRVAQQSRQSAGRPSFGGMPFSVASFNRD
ncbi:hypothetical protein [Massilia sp.]|uniref:hypothetical protein n=1 Tax=Massilia sp. TaxID=1882437 RepID=UPI0028ACE7CC|nr:hypothetical protein [Massilia sp.]